MGKDIKTILQHIKMEEGEDFSYDEAAILKAYQQDESEQSGLAIKVLSILGGLLATCAFIIFLFIAGLYDSQEGLTIFGVGCVIASVWLNKAYEKLIIDTVSVSLYVLGFVLLIFGLGDWLNDKMIALLFIVIAGTTLTLTQNYILSFIAVLVINGSFFSLVTDFSNSPDIVHLYIAINTLVLATWLLNEPKLITGNRMVSRLYNPVRIGLIVSLLVGLVLIGKRNLVPLNTDFIWLSSLVTIPVALFVVVQILTVLKIEAFKTRVKCMALAIFLLAPTVFAPAISGAMAVLLLCYLINYKTGIVMSIVAIIYFVSQYYYDLNLTLLQKSVILFVSGILFLVGYFIVHKNQVADEEV